MTTATGFNDSAAIIIVDDDEHTAQNAAELLADAAVRTGSPRQLQFIISNPDTVNNLTDYLTQTINLIDSTKASAIVIDYRLGEKSDAAYTGLELASSLRDVRPMLPIFILTQWSREENLEQKGFVVDDVMDKAQLSE